MVHFVICDIVLTRCRRVVPFDNLLPLHHIIAIHFRELSKDIRY